MDDYKKGTVKNYTAWDLNCRKFIRFNHTSSHKLKKKFARIFRRNEKQRIKEIDTKESFN